MLKVLTMQDTLRSASERLTRKILPTVRRCYNTAMTIKYLCDVITNAPIEYVASRLMRVSGNDQHYVKLLLIKLQFIAIENVKIY